MKRIGEFLGLYLLLLGVLGVKYYFFLHRQMGLNLLSASDVMFKAPEFLRQPTPIPYVGSLIEYPVIVAVWGTFWAYWAKGGEAFFWFNGLALSFFGVVCLFLVQALIRQRGGEIAGWKLLTPSILFFTFYNWDILAVFFLLAALYFLKQRKFLYFVWLTALGFWTKIFPIFCLPFVIAAHWRREPKRLWLILLGLFLAVSFLLNLPYALKSWTGWFYFFDYSFRRPPNIDSIWSAIYILSDRFLGPGFFLKGHYDQIISRLSGLVFLTVFSLYLGRVIKQRRLDPVLNTAVALGLFLLTAKVYSPQFNLWLVPLLLVLGVASRKIWLFEIFNLLVAWAVFEYFGQVYLLGKVHLDFPWLKLTYVFVVLRHLALFFLVRDLWFRPSAAKENL